MWLYGFPIPSCTCVPANSDSFLDFSIGLVETIDLAVKYALPKLKDEVETLFETQCTNYAASTSGKDNLGSWYLALLSYLLEDSTHAASQCNIVLALFRTNAAEIFTLPEPEKNKFWFLLQAWPEVALHLLATGGLDGNACKVFQDGKVPPQVFALTAERKLPSPPVTQVKPDTTGTQVKPVIAVTQVTAATPSTQVKLAPPQSHPPDSPSTRKSARIRRPPWRPLATSSTPVMPKMPDDFGLDVTPKTAVIKATPAKTKTTDLIRLSEKQTKYADSLSQGEICARD